MPELRGRLTPQGNLGGTLNTIVYASNYNVLDNKPSINSVTLQGNKTASELGLAVPADITVTSVNGETGAVVLDGSDINYDYNTTVNSKLDDLQSQIENSGVMAVNGMTGVVTLTGSNINYSAGVTLNSKIDAVEAEIPTVDYPVTSVNGETGAVVLEGSDIKYDSLTTINAKIDAVEAEIPTVDYPVTSVNGETGAVVLDGSDINYSAGVTLNSKIDTVNSAIPATATDLPLTSSPTSPTTADAIGAKVNITPQSVTPTFNSSQSDYSVPFSNTKVKTIGKVCYFTSTIRADSPYNTNPGRVIYTGLPKPSDNDTVYIAACAWTSTSNMRVIVNNNGELLCRGGGSSVDYDISFSYVTA